MSLDGNTTRIGVPLTARGATTTYGRPLGWLSAATVAAVPLVVMYAVALAGLALVGVRAGVGTLLAAAAGGVALAVGGSVRPDASGLLVDSHGAVTVVPLTVALLGAAAVGILFVHVARRSAGGPRALAVGFARVGVLFLTGLTALALLARHALPTPSVPIPKGLAELGDVAGLGQSLAPTAGFHADIPTTVVRGAAWLVVAVVVALLVWRGDFVDGRLARWHATARPVLLGLAVPVVGWLVLSAVVILVEGLAGNGAEHLGLMLLGLPNLSWMLLLLGLGVPLQVSASGSAAASLPHLARSALHATGHRGTSLSLADLAGLDHRLWLLPVAAAVLVAAGAVMAARLHAGPSSARHAVLVGGVLVVVVVALALATSISVHAHLSVADVLGGAAGLSVRARLLPAVFAGLAWGVVAGLVGGLVGRRAMRRT